MALPRFFQIEISISLKMARPSSGHAYMLIRAYSLFF